MHKIYFVENNYSGGAFQHLMDIIRLLKKMPFESELITTSSAEKIERENIGIPITYLEQDVKGIDPKMKFPISIRFVLIVRFILSKLRLLPFMHRIVKKESSFVKWIVRKDLEIFEQRYGYSNQVIEHLLQNNKDFFCVIMIGMDNVTNMKIIQHPEFRGKTFLIPIAHDTYSLAHPVFKNVIDLAEFVAFNTQTEINYVLRYMKPVHCYYEPIGVGVNTFPVDEKLCSIVRKRQAIDTDYVLYIGRIDAIKMGRLLPYFIQYKAEHANSSVKLVLVGSCHIDVPQREDIILTGYVTEEEKMALLQEALFLINPSTEESLSIIVLEAFSFGKPILVNGRCSVLKEHCLNSKAGFYYKGYHSFCKHFTQLVNSSEVRTEMGILGKAYQEKTFNWDSVEEHYRYALDCFFRQ